MERRRPDGTLVGKDPAFLHVRVECKKHGVVEYLDETERASWTCPVCAKTLDLFGVSPGEVSSEEDTTPLSRTTDPESSKEAAERIARSGKLSGWKARVLGAVRRRPGLTSGELAAEEEPGDRFLREQFVNYSHRRMPDLERDGLVRRGPLRECRSRGGRAVTWFPAEEEATDGEG